MPSLDPTQTSSLRLRYARAMNRRFRALATDVRKSFDNGALTVRVNEPARAGRFDFPSNPDKVTAFRRWLQTEIDRGILEIVMPGSPGEVNRHWQNSFLRAAYIRAVNQAEVELRRGQQLILPLPEIEAAINTGVHGETLRMMYGRAFEGLKGITDSMSAQLSDIFSRSLIEGVGPKEIARRITDRIASISKARAMVLARTETIRVFAEGKLNVMEQNQIEGVEADVEFLTAKDTNVCQQCKDLKGNVYTIQGARGIIPVHPRCFPGDALVTASPEITGVFKRHYKGKMMRIKASTGYVLRCTPNHPILGYRDTWQIGWFKAHDYRVGDKVMRCEDKKYRPIDALGIDFGPYPIEDFANTFILDSATIKAEVILDTLSFYGDADQDGFPCTVAANPKYHDEDWLHKDIFEGDYDYDPRWVCEDVFNMLDHHHQSLSLDEIVSIETEQYEGYVYDLETVGGYFVVEGIVVHNCRCTWIPANVGEEEEADAA